MSLRKIERFSPLYMILKPFFIFAFNKFWYKKTEVTGRKNIPKGVPLLLVSNHQNAMMDPLALVFNVKGQPVFLARSDIFHSAFNRFFLYFFKVMPIYRIRDGWDEVKKNELINKKVVEIFRKKKTMGIMPEGNHDKYKRLRPLKKGFARMVFQAEASTGFQLGIEILPVGIDYGSYYNFRTHLLINFGKPIKVKDFKDDFLQNPNKAMLQLMEKTAEELKKLMIHIESQHYYDSILSLTEIFKNDLKEFTGKRKTSLKDKFALDKTIIDLTEELLKNQPMIMDGLRERISDYFSIIKEFRIRDWVVKQGKVSTLYLCFRFLLLILFLPVFIYGFMTNLIPWFLPIIFSRNLEDLQFISSIRFAVFFFTYPLIIAAETILAGLIMQGIWFLLIIAASIPLTGLLAFNYYIFFKKSLGLFRWKIMEKKHKKVINQLITLRNAIVNPLIPQLNKKFREYSIETN